jgi:hypothetical protein
MQTVKRRKCGTLMIFVPLDPLTAMTVWHDSYVITLYDVL